MVATCAATAEVSSMQRAVLETETDYAPEASDTGTQATACPGSEEAMPLSGLFYLILVSVFSILPQSQKREK
jgi:hypothetical protein